MPLSSRVDFRGLAMNRQYYSPEYYEAKAELMLRITEMTTSPQVRLHVFDSAMNWTTLALEARQRRHQHAAFGIADARAPETTRLQTVRRGVEELPAITG
jgi:hypothetical protein